MPARTLAEFRKSLTASHRQRISVAMKGRNLLKKKLADESPDLGRRFNKAVLNTSHLANAANNATKAYYNVARGAKDFQLVRKYQDARKAAESAARQAAASPSRLSRLGSALDSGLRRGDTVSRIGTRLVDSATSGASRLGSIGRKGGSSTAKLIEHFNKEGNKIGHTVETVTSSSRQGLGLLRKGTGLKLLRRFL